MTGPCAFASSRRAWRTTAVKVNRSVVGKIATDRSGSKLAVRGWRVRRFKVDHHLERRRLLNRQISGICAFKFADCLPWRALRRLLYAVPLMPITSGSRWCIGVAVGRTVAFAMQKVESAPTFVPTFAACLSRCDVIEFPLVPQQRIGLVALQPRLRENVSVTMFADDPRRIGVDEVVHPVKQGGADALVRETS